MNNSKFKFLNKLLSRSYVIMLISFFLLITIFSGAYAQSNIQPRSLDINSTMITKAVVSPKSTISSYVVMSHSSKVSSHLISSSALPSTQIPSFTITNASLSISYDALAGVSNSNVIKQHVISVSKGTLFGNRMNVSPPQSLK
jgi:hypothetical protein